MVKYSRRQSRRRNMSRRRQQRGGNGSLEQGVKFQSHHVMQHGGYRDALTGAPVGFTGVLEGELRGQAGLEAADAHFSAAQLHGQSGGSRRRRRRQQGGGGAMSPASASQSYALLDSYAGAGVPPMQGSGVQMPNVVASQGEAVSSQMKGGRRNRRASRSRRASRRRMQRGGFAPVSSPTMLLSSAGYANAGLPSFKAL